MLLEPNNKWYWQYDLASQLIIIQLSDGLAMSCQLDKRNMNNLCKGRVNFCAEDASYYYYFLESVKDLSIGTAGKVQIALNAVTNLRFHKIRMPQSWFFNYAHSVSSVNTGDLITLTTTNEHLSLLVLEADERVSTCMSLSNKIELSDTKSLNKFDIIRVMNDRVQLQQKAASQPSVELFPYQQIIA